MKFGILWFPWFGYMPDGSAPGGPGSMHWDAVIAEPYYGLYVSKDPQVYNWQISLLQEMGIDWIIFSWWGMGDTDLDGVVDDNQLSAMHWGLKEILDQLRVLGTIKVTIFVEPWPAPGPFLPLIPLTQQQKDQAWDQIRTELYQPYSDIWLDWEGKPLVVGWMPMDIGEDPQAQFTYKLAGVATPPVPPAMSMMDWNALTTVDDEEFLEAVGTTKFGIVMPRFDDYQVWVNGNRSSVTRIDPWLREGWFDKNWELFYKHPDKVDLCLAWSLNDYGEQTYVEPTITPPPVGSGQLLKEKTKWYVHRLRTGQPYQRYDSPVVGVTDLRSMIGSVDASEIGLSNDAEVDEFLDQLLRRAQDHISTYLGKDLEVPREGVSYILADVAAAATQVTVEDPGLFNVGDFVQVGASERPEFAVVSDVTGDVVTFSAGLQDDHGRNAPLFRLEAPVHESATSAASDAVKEAVLRLASNIYSYALKTRRGPLAQTGEFSVELNDDTVFTRALREDLRRFQARRPLGVR